MQKSFHEPVQDQQSASNDLLYCPFCKAPDDRLQIVIRLNEAYVFCTWCQARGPVSLDNDYNKEKLVALAPKAWNIRAI